MVTNPPSTIKHFKYLLLLLIAANALALTNGIIEPDGALYASIAKLMVQKNDWINLYALGNDWLDKPHMPFWLAAISYKCFGINSFAYKFPSFVCFVISIYYTYNLTLRVYNKASAQLTALVYAASLHIILCNFDVRAEVYLATFIIAATYYLHLSVITNKILPVIISALFAALAIMTKGIFVLITIASGYVLHWLHSGQYKQFVNIKWYLLVMLSLLFCLPELYCLYSQFDLHPEKIVFNTTHVSGIKFFFWDSQFGRFFNTGPIQGSGDISFFLHTTLWAFLPWSVYLLLACIKKIPSAYSFFKQPQSFIALGAIVSFIVFSLSKFQLPHYIVILFPFFSIVVAAYLINQVNSKWLRAFSIIQYCIFGLLVALIIWLVFLFEFDAVLKLAFILVAAIAMYLYVSFSANTTKYLLQAICFSVLLSIFLNLFFYPKLLSYQAGTMLGHFQKKLMPNQKISMYKCNSYSFEFYGNIAEKRISKKEELLKIDSILFVENKTIKELQQEGFMVTTLASQPYFHITELKYDFINSKTRSNTLDSFSIIKIKNIK